MLLTLLCMQVVKVALLMQLGLICTQVVDVALCILLTLLCAHIGECGYQRFVNITLCTYW